MALNDGWILVHIPIDQFHNSRMHLSHIPQCSIQNRNVHISVLNGALWNMEQVHSGIYELGQFDWLPFIGADDILYVDHETRLLGDLLNPTRYNKMAIPRFNSSTNVTVRFGIVPVNLVQLVGIKSSIMFYITPKHYALSHFVVVWCGRLWPNILGLLHWHRGSHKIAPVPGK